MTPNGRVAILGHDEDPHLPYVTKFLGEEPLVIHTGAIPDRGLTFVMSANRSWPGIIYDNVPLELDKSPIKSVWYRSVDVRRLLPPEELAKRIKATLGGAHALSAHYRLLDDITGEPNSEYCGHELPGEAVIQEYMASSLNRLAGALPDVIPGALWVSRREKLVHADSKPRQLVIAKRLGFDVPDTLFTSSEEEAEKFLAQQGECVVKPLAIRPPNGYSQYTTVLRHSETPSLKGLNVNPHIFQQLIEPDYELRVTVVGRQAFASRVEDSYAAEARQRGIRDWRYGCEEDGLVCSAYELPPTIAWRCVGLVHELGLASGMIDLIVKKGHYYFLENNGNGQWAFVDSETVGQIGQALARMLERGAM